MKTNSKAQSTSIEPSFEPVAWFYDLLSKVVFGKILDKSKSCFIHKIKKGDKVLIIGGGTGRELNGIERGNTPELIHFIELSPTMIKQAKRHLLKSNLPITYICSDQEAIPSIEYDVVITHYFLDLFPANKLRNVIEKITMHTHSNSIWLVADFKPTKTSYGIAFQSIMYTFFRLLCHVKAKEYPMIEEGLQEYSWYLRDQKIWSGLVYSQVYEKKRC